MNDNEKGCSKCASEFVPANTDLKLNGALPLDGTYNLDGNGVCPKCHPELVKED